MRPRSILRRLAAGLVLLATASLHRLAATPAAPPPAELETSRADFVRAHLAGDPAALLRACAPDVRLMPEFQPTIFGRDHAAAYYHAFLARFEIRACARRIGEVVDLGSLLATTGTFTQHLIRRDRGSPLELAGKFLELWSRTDTGGTLLIASAWNYDHPVATPDDLRFAGVPAVNVALQPHPPIRTPLLFELAALNRWMETVISQHDGALWPQAYADDALLLLNHRPPISGRAAIDADLALHAREVPIFEHLDLRNDRVDDLGRYVIEYASHTAHWRAGDSSGVSTGKDLRIWRRDPSGPLRIFRHIAMYD